MKVNFGQLNPIRMAGGLPVQQNQAQPMFSGALQTPAADTLTLRFAGETAPAANNTPFYTAMNESSRLALSNFRLSAIPLGDSKNEIKWESALARVLLSTPEVQQYLKNQELNASEMMLQVREAFDPPTIDPAQVTLCSDKIVNHIGQEIENFAKQEREEEITPVTMWRWLMKGDSQLKKARPLHLKELIATLSVSANPTEEARIANLLLEAPPDVNMSSKFAEWFLKAKKPILSLDDPRIKEAEQILPELAKRVFGQPEGIAEVAESVYNGLTAFPNEKKPFRPTARILAMGPTGTGKTFTPEQLAEIQGRRIINVSCNELHDKTGLGKLTGAGPGYAGHDSKNFVDELMDANKDMMENGAPAPIIIFDEIEKADPEVQQIIMTFLDKGIITGSDRGKVGYGADAIVFLTSNRGQDEMNDLKARGATAEEIREIALESLAQPWKDVHGQERKFKPEFLARIEKKLVYDHITQEDATRALDTKLKHSFIEPTRKYHNCDLVITQEVKDAVLKEGYSWRYGLRLLEDATDSFFTPFNEERIRLIKTGGLKPGGKMIATLKEDGTLKLDYQPPKAT